MINLPQSGAIRIIYGLGIGAGGIGQSLTIDGKFYH